MYNTLSITTNILLCVLFLCVTVGLC